MSEKVNVPNKPSIVLPIDKIFSLSRELAVYLPMTASDISERLMQFCESLYDDEPPMRREPYSR